MKIVMTEKDIKRVLRGISRWIDKNIDGARIGQGIVECVKLAADTTMKIRAEGREPTSADYVKAGMAGVEAIWGARKHDGRDPRDPADMKHEPDCEHGPDIRAKAVTRRVQELADAMHAIAEDTKNTPADRLVAYRPLRGVLFGFAKWITSEWEEATAEYAEIAAVSPDEVANLRPTDGAPAPAPGGAA